VTYVSAPALLIIIRVLIGLCLAAFVAYSGISVWAAFRWRQSRRETDPDWTPGVTILKPVRGVESAHTYDNFASFCCQDYPLDKLQIVFGCLDPADPVIAVIEQLQRDFPEVQIDLVCAGKRGIIGPNLKVCNLLSMLPVAKYELLALCDSDMRVEKDYIRRIGAPFGLQDSAQATAQDAMTLPVGLVTCPYRGFLPESPAAVMEALGIGADFIPGALTSRALEGVGFAFGSTIVIPRTVLGQIGGFETILTELADDFRMGEAVRKLGFEVVLSDYVVNDVLGPERFRPMWDRRLRWAKTVRSCRPGGYVGLFVTYGIPIALLFALLMGRSPAGLAALAGILAVRLGSAALIAAACTRDPLVLKYLPLLPISDILSFTLYLCSFCGNTIVWRGDTFRLSKGGKMVRLSEAPDSPLTGAG